MPRTPTDVFIGRYVEAGTARWREAALADVVEQQASMGISQVDPERRWVCKRGIEGAHR